jgi:hypothetical protein
MVAYLVNRGLRRMNVKRTGNEAAETDFATLSRHSPWKIKEIHEQTRDSGVSAEIRTGHLQNTGRGTLPLEPNC